MNRRIGELCDRAARALLASGLALLATGFGRAETRPWRIVVLPSVDQARGKADRIEIDGRLGERLDGLGFDTVSNESVLAFLMRHRIRYTGGVTSDMRALLAEELGAEAVLCASVDLYETEAPPRVAFNARILSVDSGAILWADETALAGEDRPGALGLGEIDDAGALLARAVERLFGSIHDSPLADPEATGTHPVWPHDRGRGEHRPRRVFRAPELDLDRERPARLAVLPFENQATHADAGDVIAGLFVTHLAGRERFEVLEPGEVREVLLQGRVIQQEGLSLAQADFVREMLDADLAVTGRVLEYVEPAAGGVPRVTFSVWVFDLRRRTVVWSGHSASRGTDGVVFFDLGRVRSARSLAGTMVRAAAHDLASGKPARAPRGSR